MKAKGIDPNEWEVVTFVKNVWQSQAKDGTIKNLCQSKLSVRPKSGSFITFDDIDSYFARDEKNIIHSDEPKVNTDKHVLEIDLADLHCGLLSWKGETGSQQGVMKTAEQFLGAIKSITRKARDRDVGYIYFCSLGDIIHVDNDRGETTKGTLQQVDGRLGEIFCIAVDLMELAIKEMRGLGVPVSYIYTRGNHDQNTGYFLAKTLEKAFQQDSEVIFDTAPNPQKAIHFGKVLVGLTHGDMPRKNRGSWLMHDYRTDFGESRFVEEHCGHIHDEEVSMINGIRSRSVMALTGNSFWEHQQGYRSDRGIQSFLWDAEHGLEETWYYYL